MVGVDAAEMAGLGCGPGETQLEVDRREVGRRISKLKEELENVRASSAPTPTARKSGSTRYRIGGLYQRGQIYPVKYADRADIYVANQLFATLDPTTRKAVLPGVRPCCFPTR